jgi:hypothetical protein
MTFKREFSEDLRKKLKEKTLFREKLLKDIFNVKVKDKNGRCKPIDKVFPAIRDGYIDFYYKGGRLFEFTDKGEFKTNVKYGFVPSDEIIKGYTDISIEELKSKELSKVTDFIDGYKNIKERCALYNKALESAFVAKLFDNYSYVTSTEDIVLLDIEAAFSKQDEKAKKKQDRPDIVLYHKKKQLIKFVEAKLYSNNELSSSIEIDIVDEGDNVTETIKVPKVIKQIHGYEKQIKAHKTEIKNAYTKYIKTVNDLFGLNLPYDKIEICEKVGLIFFNYSGADEVSDRYKQIREKLEDALDDKRNVYPIGDTDGAKLKKLFRNFE